jgi:hypothetical protein
VLSGLALRNRSVIIRSFLQHVAAGRPSLCFNFFRKQTETMFSLLLRNQLELLDFHDHKDLCSDLGKVSEFPLSVITLLLMICSNEVCWPSCDIIMICLQQLFTVLLFHYQNTLWSYYRPTVSIIRRVEYSRDLQQGEGTILILLTFKTQWVLHARSSTYNEKLSILSRLCMCFVWFLQ